MLEAGQKKNEIALNKKSSDTGGLGQVMGARDPPPPVPQDADDGFEQFHGALMLATLAASALLAGVRRVMNTPGERTLVEQRMDVLTTQIEQLQEAAQLQEARICQLQQERDECARIVRDLGREIDVELHDMRSRQNEREQQEQKLANRAREHLALAETLAARDKKADEGRRRALEREQEEVAE